MPEPARETLHEGLLIDYGGVLTTPVVHSFRAFCADVGLPPEAVREAFVEAYRAPEGDGLIQLLETGRMTDTDFGQALAQALEERTGVQVPADGVLRRLFASVEPEERMLAAVERLRAAGVRTALLSNSWGESGYPRHRFDALFDAVVISGEVGMRKPDPAIFRHALDEIGLSPAACVFVDDLEHNVAAAEELGISGVLHRDPEQTIRRLAALFRLDAARLVD